MVRAELLEAGRRLAQSLLLYKGRRDVVVVAITEASFAIAEGAAAALRIPFDIVLVRTIPGGAVARGAYVPGAKALESAGISLMSFVEAARLKEADIAQTETTIRGNRAPTRLTGSSIVLVDDGTSSVDELVTAMTAIRRHGVHDIIVVAPRI